MLLVSSSCCRAALYRSGRITKLVVRSPLPVFSTMKRSIDSYFRKVDSRKSVATSAGNQENQQPTTNPEPAAEAMKDDKAPTDASPQKGPDVKGSASPSNPSSAERARKRPLPTIAPWEEHVLKARALSPSKRGDKQPSAQEGQAFEANASSAQPKEQVPMQTTDQEAMQQPCNPSSDPQAEQKSSGMTSVQQMRANANKNTALAKQVVHKATRAGGHPALAELLLDESWKQVGHMLACWYVLCTVY